MKTRCQPRSGNVLFFALFLMVVMFGVLAFAVDLGYMQLVRAQMQSSADAAALAATWELIDEDALAGSSDFAMRDTRVRSTAGQFSGWNMVSSAPPELTLDDVQIGFLGDLSDANLQLDSSDPSRFNAVQIRVRRAPEQNGEVSLFFARVLGIDTYSGQARATAVFLNNIAGFRIPAPGETLGILPLAFNKALWDGLMGGGGSDDFAFDGDQVVSGVGDGIREITLFPQDTGAPGNFGTIKIGPSNGTNVLRSQIESGLTAEDLSIYPNQELMIDPATGILSVTGDTGISAGMEAALQVVVGKPRIVALYTQVSGNGNNATYSIVQFVGVRIMEVDFSGGLNSSKRLILQPANVTIPGAIRATVLDPMNPTSEEQKSQFVFSPVWLIR